VSLALKVAGTVGKAIGKTAWKVGAPILTAGLKYIAAPIWVANMAVNLPGAVSAAQISYDREMAKVPAEERQRIENHRRNVVGTYFDLSTDPMAAYREDYGALSPQMMRFNINRAHMEQARYQGAIEAKYGVNRWAPIVAFGSKLLLG
jgi:hypothetical protein